MADAAVPGTLQVSNDVIADLAGYAAMMCYGVVGMAYTDDQQNLQTLLSMSQMSKGTPSPSRSTWWWTPASTCAP